SATFTFFDLADCFSRASLARSSLLIMAWTLFLVQRLGLQSPSSRGRGHEKISAPRSRSFTGGEISCGAFGQHRRGGILCVGRSFDLGKLKGDTSFTFGAASRSRHIRSAVVSSSSALSINLRVIVSASPSSSASASRVAWFRDRFGLPLGLPLLPGSNGRPRCFAAVFSAASTSSTALPPYMADHYTTRMR